MLKTQLFEKRQTFQWKEFLACFFSHYGVWQTSRDNIWWSTRYSDVYCGSYSNNSVTPKKLLKTQLFEKRQTFQWKEFLACFFSHYGVWQTSRDNIWWSTRYSDVYCGSYSNNSVTPKKLLKTQLFLKKKASFPVKKRFWPIFWPILECDKPQLTRYTGQQSFLTIPVEVIGLIL